MTLRFLANDRADRAIASLAIIVHSPELLTELMTTIMGIVKKKSSKKV